LTFKNIARKPSIQMPTCMRTAKRCTARSGRRTDTSDWIVLANQTPSSPSAYERPQRPGRMEGWYLQKR